MTEAQLAKCAEKWRQRLIPEWRVKLSREPSSPEKEGPDGFYGECLISTDHREIVVWINQKAHSSDAEIEETVVHELVHALVRPIEEIYGSISTSLGSEAATQAQERIDTESELLVERTARIALALDRDLDINETRWNK